jgi:putative SOS response-associated peptidase YedK
VLRIDRQPFGMAGVYERWLSPDGEVLDTCAILTTRANALLRGVHDRMPVIVPPENYARWLDAAEEDVGDLLVPAGDDVLRVQSISKRVNSVQNDDASLIEPAAEEPAPAEPEAEHEEPELPLQPRLL